MSKQLARSNLQPEHLTYTVAEVSLMLGLPRPKVYILIETGALRAFKVGSDWRVPRAGLNELLSKTESIIDI